jgi:hypothetical protein
MNDENAQNSIKQVQKDAEFLTLKRLNEYKADQERAAAEDAQAATADNKKKA